MVVTVNTDASFHHKSKIGGFAFWIHFGNWKIQMSGPLKKCDSAIEAELMCMANALYVLQNSGINDVQKIIIYSDCKNAFPLIGLNKTPGSPGRKVANLLRAVRKRQFFKPEYELRHIKAHTNKQDMRSLINDWCDRNARYQMRILLKKNNL